MGFGVALKVVEIFGEVFFLIGEAGGVEVGAGLGIFTLLDMEAGAEKKVLGKGFRLRKFFSKGGDELNGFFDTLFLVGRLVGSGIRLGSDGLENEIGGFLFNIFFFGGGFYFAVGDDGFGPFAEVVLGTCEEEVSTGRLREVGLAWMKVFASLMVSSKRPPS